METLGETQLQYEQPHTRIYIAKNRRESQIGLGIRTLTRRGFSTFGSSSSLELARFQGDRYIELRALDRSAGKPTYSDRYLRSFPVSALLSTRLPIKDQVARLQEPSARHAGLCGIFLDGSLYSGSQIPSCNHQRF